MMAALICDRLEQHGHRSRSSDHDCGRPRSHGQLVSLHQRDVVDGDCRGRVEAKGGAGRRQMQLLLRASAGTGHNGHASFDHCPCIGGCGV